MRRRSPAIGALILLIGLFTASPEKAYAQDARGFIAALGNQAIQVLGPGVPQAQRIARFRQIFQSDFDVPGSGSPPRASPAPTREAGLLGPGRGSVSTKRRQTCNRLESRPAGGRGRAAPMMFAPGARPATSGDAEVLIPHRDIDAHSLWGT